MIGAQKQALLDILNTAGIATSPIGKLLGAAADNGLLNLLDRLPEVRQIANTVLSILNGGVIAKLQDIVDQQLDLRHVLAVAAASRLRQAGFVSRGPALRVLR